MDDDIDRAFADIKTQVENTDVLYDDFQEKHPGGAPAEAYIVIAAKSAAGAAGILAVNELYQYIRTKYVDEDGKEAQETDGPKINVEHIHVNLGDEIKTKKECRKEKGKSQTCLTNFSQNSSGKSNPESDLEDEN